MQAIWFNQLVFAVNSHNGFYWIYDIESNEILSQAYENEIEFL